MTRSKFGFFKAFKTIFIESFYSVPWVFKKFTVNFAIGWIFFSFFILFLADRFFDFESSRTMAYMVKTCLHLVGTCFFHFYCSLPCISFSL